MDILQIFNSVLDLKRNRLTFRKFLLLKHLPDAIVETFNINGKDAAVTLDTGKEDFLSGGPK